MARITDLYIFATSTRPEPYLNSIMHWMHEGAISRVTIVCIHEHEYMNEDSEAQALATAVLAKVQELLTSLANGLYPISKESRSTAVTDKERDEYRGYLEKLQYIQLSAVGVRWTELEARIKEFRKGGQSAFDVTAFKNYLLVDVVALLLSLGDSNIYSFELRRRPTFDSSDLLPALKSTDFVYRGLTNSRHVDAAMRKMVARSVTFRFVIAVTVLTAIPVILVQIYFPTSWVQSALVALGAAVSLASWLFSLRQRSTS